MSYAPKYSIIDAAADNLPPAAVDAIGFGIKFLSGYLWAAALGLGSFIICLPILHFSTKDNYFNGVAICWGIVIAWVILRLAYILLLLVFAPFVVMFSTNPWEKVAKLARAHSGIAGYNWAMEAVLGGGDEDVAREYLADPKSLYTDLDTYKRLGVL